MTAEHERLGWLRTLIAAYRQEHEWHDDPDPSATAEMIREYELLADDLEARLPLLPVETVAAFPDDSEIPF